MNNKTILFNEEARNGLKKGIDIVADAVKVTLGYGGRTVVVSETGLPSRTTKDGITVANSIKLRDEVLDAGAKFIKEISAKTADGAGDGTTTVVVLMQHLVSEGLKLIKGGINPVYLKKGMDAAAANVVTHLKTIKVNVNDKLLLDVATVSANNDPELGRIISDAYLKLGQHGIISVEDSKSNDTYIEIVDGFQFDCGFLVHHFINNHAKNTCELEHPYIFMAEGKINDPKEIWDLLNKVATEKRSLVIIAEDFDRSVIQNLLLNLSQNNFKTCLIKYNFTGETKQELIYDLCAITGATIAEKKGDQLKNLRIEYLGECEKIIISQEETIIIKGKKENILLNSRIEDAKVKIEEAKHIFIKQRQEKRFAKLSGCLAVCYVGGTTEVEISEKKDRIDDSIRATKAAIEEGVLPGGGTALIRCEQMLTMMHSDNKHFREGILLVMGCLEQPAIQIIKNNGEDWVTILRNIRELHGWQGYNAATCGIQNLMNSGIVDPFKVVRLCIENAVSGAGQVLLSEALIVTDNN